MSFFRNKKVLRIVLRILFIVALLLVIDSAAFGRAGGAGGGHSSSHSSGSHSYSGSSGYSGGSSYGSGYSSSSSGDFFFLIVIFQVIGNLVGLLVQTIGIIPTLLLGAAIIVALALWRRKHRHDSSHIWSNLPETEDLDMSGRVEGIGSFRKRNPDFDEEAFIEKVETAFMGIQDAWSAQNLAGVRRYISDGVYQRFNTQFTMMRLLEQTNPVSDIHIHQIRIDRAEQDRAYDILHVGIHARMKDSFVCKINHSLDQEGDDTFTEYWSFLRKNKKDTKTTDTDSPNTAESHYKDIYQTTSCPNCGAQLPTDLGERGQCPYCSTLINSGEYDWVLSEITQAEDYAADRIIENNANLKSGIDAVEKEDPDFCVQLAEDKASNAFMQIVAARATQNPALMRRFVNDHAFDLVSKLIGPDHIVYNRLFLNRVNLISVRSDATDNTVAFAMNMTSQRVRLEDRKIRLLDPALRQEELVLEMSRKRNAGAPKGSLYQHQCSNCGAPIQDSLDPKCPYCGSNYNAGTHEWVVNNLLPMSEYRTWIDQTPQRAHARVNPAIFENLYDVRDYAMSNLMVMVAADGVFADEEREFAEAMAAKLGFKIDNLDALFQMAASGRLGLRMPDDVTKRAKIVEMMQEAAEADGSVGIEEQKILDYLKNSFVDASHFKF